MVEKFSQSTTYLELVDEKLNDEYNKYRAGSCINLACTVRHCKILRKNFISIFSISTIQIIQQLMYLALTMQNSISSLLYLDSSFLLCLTLRCGYRHFNLFILLLTKRRSNTYLGQKHFFSWINCGV